MRRLLAAASLALLLLAERPSSAEGLDLSAMLATLVDLPTQQERIAEATKLAARQDVTIDQWLAAAKAFGSFERPPAGPRDENPVLVVGDAREKTAIACRVPPGYAPGVPAPLLLSFHGAGGEGHDNDDLWSEVADKLGMIVVAPTDPSADLGYRYTEIERQRAYAALRWARRRFNVDENRVYVTGVSRGGHLAWDVALRRGDQFAAMAPMIGAPRLHTAEGQNNLRYLENVASMPIRDLQGTKDDVYAVLNLRGAFKRLRDYGAKDAQLVEFPEMGHDFDPKAVEWGKFFAEATRRPTPARVVRMCARLDEGRSFWVEVAGLAPSVKEVFRADIDARKLKTMDDEAKRAWLEDEAEKHTGRIEAKLDAPGKFTVTTSQVTKFRLLLTRELFDPQAPVEVAVNARAPLRIGAQLSKVVLLKEFAERFDRTFLPIAEVVGQ